MRRWLPHDPTFYSGLVLVALSAGVAWHAVDLGLGVMRSPGPGFVFFWTAVFQLALALRMMVRGLRSRVAVAPLWRGLAWGKVIGVTLAVVAYALLLERMGYLVTTGLFATYLFALLAETRRKWWAIVGGAAATTAITYLVFDRAFSVQLPKGIFGF
jgi:hypothetical protein